jgi:hypothetical protein
MEAVSALAAAEAAPDWYDRDAAAFGRAHRAEAAPLQHMHRFIRCVDCDAEDGLAEAAPLDVERDPDAPRERCEGCGNVFRHGQGCLRVRFGWELDIERLARALNASVGTEGWLRLTPPNAVDEWRENARIIAREYAALRSPDTETAGEAG